MRAVLSTIGTRGDVRPVVALATELRALGAEARLVVPPDFCAWIEGLGFEAIPIGPDLKQATASDAPKPMTPERAREMVADSVADQFRTIGEAARGCDVILGATAIQVGGPSVGELLGIPYVFAGYCPAIFPSPHHGPLPLPGRTPPPTADNRELWELNAQSFNATFGAALNANRAAAGLPPVADVRSHIFTARPWLAADPILAPWPDPDDDRVVQTGAWILPDERPLPPELEAFLDAGEPPVYFGFGTAGAPGHFSEVIAQTARALGRRAIVFREWGDLTVDGGADLLAIGEVNQQALFGRVAAAVHHGGAGTTTTATASGVPQVVVPQRYDQHYFAAQVDRLRIGTAHAPGTPTVESLTRALELALRPEVAERARAVAPAVRRDGARRAAELLVAVAARD